MSQENDTSWQREQFPMHRYLNDSTYKRVVDMMEHLLHSCQLTPSEMREAAVLACIHYENHNIRLVHLQLTPELHLRMRDLEEMVQTITRDN